MRKPKNSAEVFHYWANLVMPKARCGNVSYDGPVLYSYAEPIGLLLSNNRVLINNRHFSVTTSGHQSAARVASSHMRECLAPYVTRYYNSEYDLTKMHNDNRHYWEQKSEDALVELIHHPRRKKSVADKIAFAVTSYNNYREFFELDWPEMTNEEMKKLVEESAKQKVEERRRAEERIAEQNARREAEEAQELENWRVHLSNRRTFTKTALRLSLDGKDIETTHGARVPVESAVHLWKLANRQRNEGLNHIFGNRFPVGPYNLDSIDKNGALHINCHTITYDELVLMAKKLNFI